jgi:hypothetical protein
MAIFHRAESCPRTIPYERATHKRKSDRRNIGNELRRRLRSTFARLRFAVRGPEDGRRIVVPKKPRREAKKLDTVEQL